MRKFNFSSKKGFTLIELLVVIGILAVLAAIAIPTVAGLIDRANVSADKTNANEMTNAVERFASEYELYCQDIASGKIKDATNLDSAQARVYNVTNALSRSDIEKLESEAGFNGRAIDEDTKYPVNADTMQAVVQAYTKTSSATFEPKQSDMHYWYSPDCGIVVFDEPDASKSDLNAQVVSGKDASGKTLDGNTEWIDITLGASLGGGGNDDVVDDASTGWTVPAGCTYYVGVTALESQNYTGATQTYSAGETLPVGYQPAFGDVLTDGFYEYRYNCNFVYQEDAMRPWIFLLLWEENTSLGGWSIGSMPNPPSSFTQVYATIAGKPLVSMRYIAYQAGIPENFTIPNTVTDISYAFVGFSGTYLPKIPGSVTNMTGAFHNLNSSGLTIEIDANPTKFDDAFTGLDFCGHNIKLTGASTMLDEIGKTGIGYCEECNGVCKDY